MHDEINVGVYAQEAFTSAIFYGTETFDRLPLDTRVAYVRTFKALEDGEADTASQIIACLVIDLGEAGMAFFREIEWIFDSVNPADVYRAAFPLIAEARKGSSESAEFAANSLELRLMKRATDGGYRLGIVEIGSYKSRWFRITEQQFQVREDRITYVQRKWSDTPLIEGEQVFYKPSASRKIAKDVRAAVFIPATRRDDWRI